MPRRKTKTLGELSDQQIATLVHKLRIPLFGGCYAKDQLSPLPTGYMYVINMQDHTGGGTHWVLLDARELGTFRYFDSYGVAPPRPILTFAKKRHANIQYNREDIQTYTSEACGWFCLYMMMKMQKRSMGDIIHEDFVDLNTHQPLSNPDDVLRNCFQSLL